MPPPPGTKAASGFPAGKRMVVGCLAVSAAGVAGSVGLALLPMVSGWKIEPASPLELLPSLSAMLALAGGGMCLMASRREGNDTAGPSGADLPPGTVSGLQTLVRELGSLLAEERSRVATLQEVCNASMRDARAVSTRVQNLAETALDAETRLNAGVTRAGEAALHVQNALPEIATMVRRGIADVLAERLKVEADTSLGVLRAALTEAAGQMAELGETAATVQRNVSALETAGREISVASGTVVSRLAGALGQIESAAAALPDSAANVTAAADHAASSVADAAEQAGARLDQMASGLTEAAAQAADALKAAAEQAGHSVGHAAGSLRADAEALNANGKQMHHAALELRQSAQALGMAGTQIAGRIETAAAQIDHATATLPEAVAAITATAEEAARQFADAATGLSGEAAALGTMAQDVRATTDALRAGSQAVDAAGTRLVALIGDAVTHIDAVLAEVPPAVSALATAASDAARRVQDTAAETAREVQGTVGELRDDSAALASAVQDAQAMLRLKTEALHDASTALRDDGLALAGAAREAQQLMQEQADTLKAAGETLADTGQLAVAALAEAAASASAQITAMTAEAAQSRRDVAGLAEMTHALGDITNALIDGARKLDAAGERVAASGAAAATRLDAEATHGSALLEALPALSAEIEAAAAHLRAELSAAVQQVADASYAATQSAAGIEVRVGEAMNALNGAASAIQTQAEARLADLPDVAARLSAAAGTLGQLAEGWPSGMLATLPDVAERIEMATQRLAELDTLSARMESVLGDVLAEAEQEPLATLAGLSADIGESVRRVEAALADHDGIWPTLQNSISQVHAAAIAVVETKALERARPGDMPGGPEALATTLRQFDELDAHSQTLLRQTEALAEAVLGGRAPGLPPLLASRTPGLLAGIETTTRRLRSVATALALASDGTTVAARPAA